MEGFIHLHRKFLSWEWHDDANVVVVFIHLLCLANFSQKEWHGMLIDRGQLVTSIDKMSKMVGLTPKQVRNCFRKLTNTGEVFTKKITLKWANGRANHATLVTICNYDIYQSEENIEGQMDGRTKGKWRANEGQVLNNDKKDNIYIEDKSSMSKSSSSTSTQEPINFDAFKNFWNERMRDKEVRSIISISEERRKMIRSRVAEYGKESLMKVVEKTASSRFLNGDNKNGFIADFGWVIRPRNFLKILEGNYDDR